MEESALETTELPLEWYAASQGYDPDFLGLQIDLPLVSEALRQDTVQLLDGSGHELRYVNFSVVMCQSRQLAFFAAVNIDGAQLQSIPRGRDAWYFDSRVDRGSQMDPRVYGHPDLDRGHLVRRLDPVWGTAAEEANEDTFHFTNCAPQHRSLNRTTWLGLEDYVLRNTDLHDLRVTVFTGPVFRPDDTLYLDEFPVPAEFWKVVVATKQDGQLSATAYLQSQRDLISDLESFSFGEYKTFQVPVSHLESLTGLSFGSLRQHDPLMPPGLESVPYARAIVGPSDLRL